MSLGKKRQPNPGQTLRKSNSQGQGFVPSSLPCKVSIRLLRKRLEEDEVASRCPAGQHHREMPQSFIYTVLNYSPPHPAGNFLDEHQEMRFKYNTEKCARAGCPPSRKLWLPQNLATKEPSSTCRLLPCPNHCQLPAVNSSGASSTAPPLCP